MTQENHLVTRVKGNKVAFFPATPPPPHRPRPRGRPKKYGKSIKVAALLKETGRLQEAPSPVYGEQGVTIIGVYLSINDYHRLETQSMPATIGGVATMIGLR